MNQNEKNIRISSMIFMVFIFMALIHKTDTLLFTSDNDKLNKAMDDSLILDILPCNATCSIIINNTCAISETSCYIEKQCYQANQTRLNDTLSCLQCQPKKIQTQWSFNPYCSADLLCGNQLFLRENTCDNIITLGFYSDPISAVIKYYNFSECSYDPKQCQQGFFRTKNRAEPYACCPGYFCPEGQICMIPCRTGSYCPSPLRALNGVCRTPVNCPVHQTDGYEQYGCGGSILEGFCPAKTYCSNPTVSQPCSNGTDYCPTGVQNALSCPYFFTCLDGRVRKEVLLITVFSFVFILIIIYALVIKIYQWCVLNRKLCGQHELHNHSDVSDYFKKQHGSRVSRGQIQLHIHLNQAKLRDVTHFDPKLNQGFTGRIPAGKLTALMGGSGCGKSSLLETIHGRRRLRRNGRITFAEYEPLTTLLTDYVGYVPQADIMHNDLTVFETVYYSARTRRLDDSKKVIINDVCFVLEKLGLENMHNSMTKTLSGGQRKRVNIAMEVAACPKVLLLDEPTSGLDTASCDDLFDLLQLIKCSAAGPVTIIMVIHQPSHELFEQIDEVFFLTPRCCLAYQGPREQAKEYLKSTLFSDLSDCPLPRHNDSDTCFIMLTKAQHHIDNCRIRDTITNQDLHMFSMKKRVWFPFWYVLKRSARQAYMRGATTECAYLAAYFLLGTCLGYLFENKQQGTCNIQSLPTLYFLISLAFGILTCVSSQRLFGVETTDQTFERESRNYFHPVQYWLAKSLIDIIRLFLYPLLFLSIFYIEVVPRGSFLYYYGVMILLSFVCTGIGQLTSVLFKRTEYAYLAGTIIALLSCMLSGFSPTKRDLRHAKSIVTISFSRHVQHLLFRHETALYVKGVDKGLHIWSLPVESLREYYSFNDSENPYLWLIIIGIFLRLLTIIFLFIKSEYRSKIRFRMTHFASNVKSIFSCERYRERSSHKNYISRGVPTPDMEIL